MSTTINNGMSISITRVSDNGEGAECADPRQSHRSYTVTYETGAATVFVDNLSVTIVGSVGSQTCGHSGVASTGSSTVFVENMAIHRVGDIGDGGAGDNFASITGSSTVFAG
jgi:uncharacterized Zn-binding protein involved in type VI secretion